MLVRLLTAASCTLSGSLNRSLCHCAPRPIRLVLSPVSEKEDVQEMFGLYQACFFIVCNHVCWQTTQTGYDGYKYIIIMSTG